MLRACITGFSCLAFLYGGFWVLEYRTRRRRVKVLPVVTHHKHGIDVDTYLEDKDRISRLPDDVISLIVSRLDTRGAVRTSVLSRRWKHVYTLISEASFSCHRMCMDNVRKGKKLSELQRKFVRVVDTFLQHHSGSRMMSFELVSCFGGCILDSLRRWMNSVGRLGVERLTLQYFCPYHERERNPPVFDYDLLPEASSVKYLCLHGFSLQISSQNALRDLELIGVAFTSEAVECILLNCCSLQSLIFRSCKLPSKLHIHGPDLKLKNLVVIACSKVAEIDLSAINLTTFVLCTSRMLMLSFTNVPLLQNLFIEVHDREEDPCVFGKVAKDLPHLKCMSYWTEARFFETFEAGGVNKLSNLRQLALLLVDESNLDLLALATILDLCPLLHKFHLWMELPSTFNGGLAEKRVVSHHTQLKEVEFNGFSETENEYNFILYIENVVSLKRLSIFLDWKPYHVLYGAGLGTKRNRGYDGEKQRIIHERLQGLTMSKNVEIMVV